MVFQGSRKLFYFMETEGLRFAERTGVGDLGPVEDALETEQVVTLVHLGHVSYFRQANHAGDCRHSACLPMISIEKLADLLLLSL